MSADPPASPMSPAQLAEIQARAEKATRGIWCVLDDDGPLRKPPMFGIEGDFADGQHFMAIGEAITHSLIGYYEAVANADFIAHARTDIPNLLAHIASLTSENAGLQKARAEDQQRLFHVEGALLAASQGETK